LYSFFQIIHSYIAGKYFKSESLNDLSRLMQFFDKEINRWKNYVVCID
jgi:hypothetical protein